MGSVATARSAGTSARPSGGALTRSKDALAFEWRKLATVRSTWWCLAAVAGFNLIAATVLGIVLPRTLSTSQQAGMNDRIGLPLAGLHLSQVAIGVLGVLVISSEYTSGMIRASLAAVPRRRLLLAAKTAVLAAVATGAGLATCYGAYLLFQVSLPAGSPLRAPISDPGVVRALSGAGLYLAVLALAGLGLGAILRSSAGAMTALLGALFVPTLIIGLLPASWQNTVGPYLPMSAAEAVYSLGSGTGHLKHLAPWAGFGVLCAYAAAALAAGFILIGRRDA
jgi:ABC-type transport system involved in multi-copper enzyme maturation permease subunit